MRRRRRRSKKRGTVQQLRQRHAVRRAAERYWLEVSDRDLEAFVHLIRSGKAAFVRRVSNTKTEWVLSVEDRQYRVGYNSSTKQIVTFLPLHTVSEGSQQ